MDYYSIDMSLLKKYKIIAGPISMNYYMSENNQPKKTGLLVGSSMKMTKTMISGGIIFMNEFKRIDGITFYYLV